LANGRINKPIGMAKQETVVRTDRPIVVDATDHIAGRLASNVAKLLMQGNRVSVVNCEKIMMSGTRSNQIKEYREFLEINSIINYKHGPVHYRRPDTLMAKMIRQMLPFDRKPSGKAAHQRLRTYIGSPKELKSLEKIQFEKAKIKRSSSNYTTMGELGRVIGWTE
jgi:large subunit ribosomal protein L13